MKITTYNKLKKYESYLTTAYEANFIRSLTNAQMDDLISIAKEIGIEHKNNHCPKCALEFIKKLAKPYFEQKKKLELKKQEKKNDKQREK